jgi:hypothetical protein
MSDVLQRVDFDCGRVWFRESFRNWICHVDLGSGQRVCRPTLCSVETIGRSVLLRKRIWLLMKQSNGVRVKGQSKDGMAVAPHDIQFKSLANGFAILLQMRLPQSSRLNGCQRSAIDALQNI